MKKNPLSSDEREKEQAEKEKKAMERSNHRPAPLQSFTFRLLPLRHLLPPNASLATTPFEGAFP